MASGIQLEALLAYAGGHAHARQSQLGADSTYLGYNVTCAERLCGRSRVEVIKPGSSEHWPIVFSEQQHVHPTPLAWLP